ncbi:MAG: VCBS repeat-containing protein [Pirellulales bacterium]
MADLDHDGNLDIYVDNYVDSLRTCRDTRGAISTCNPQNFSGVQDMLWHNLGDGSFQDGVERFGLAAPDGKGLGVVVTDLNNDGWEDIYVANDTTPNFLFKNNAGAKFEEIGLSAGVALSPDGQAQAGMGIGAADYNNDGWIDICVTNFYDEPNNLYINHRDDFFTDEAARGHLLHPSKPMLGFGVIAEDFDADGDPDLIVANGHIDDYRWRGEPWKMPTQVFRNLGDAVFEECSQLCGDYFSAPTLGRGAAVLDWNNDGKLDVIIVHQDRPAVLLENRTPGAECIAVRPIALAGNRSAVGARLVENGNTERVVSEIRSGNGYISSSQQAWWIPKAAVESGRFFMVFPGSKPQRLPPSTRSGEIFFQTND